MLKVQKKAHDRGEEMTKKTAGHPLHIVETYDRIEVGTIRVGTNQVPISLRSVPCYRVIVQSSNDNAALVYVGSAAGCYHELAPGEWVTVEINDVEKIYARAAQGVFLIVNWAAMA